MALTTAVHDSLPYIDTEPTASERAAAQSLIGAAALPSENAASHPSLPALPEQHFSPVMEAELLRIATKQALSAIDLARYEALEPPSTSPHSDERHPETLSKWQTALAQAYTAHAYLGNRAGNLALLEQFGKNAWLVGNSQTEDVLRGLERQLHDRKAEIDLLAVERRSAQEAVGGEVKGLEDSWRKAVGRVLETEIAAEGLRREVLERRRMGAS